LTNLKPNKLASNPARKSTIKNIEIKITNGAHLLILLIYLALSNARKRNNVVNSAI
jgi:hypothetical protein